LLHSRRLCEHEWQCWAAGQPAGWCAGFARAVDAILSAIDAFSAVRALCSIDFIDSDGVVAQHEH
jgi:hypothetical protein